MNTFLDLKDHTDVPEKLRSELLAIIGQENAWGAKCRDPTGYNGFSYTLCYDSPEWKIVDKYRNQSDKTYVVFNVPRGCNEFPQKAAGNILH